MDPPPINVDGMTPHFTFVWDIENACSLTLSTRLLSPVFVAQPIEMTRWHLAIEFNSVDQLVLDICRDKDDCSTSFEIDFEVSQFAYGKYIDAKRGRSEFEKQGNRCAIILNGDALMQAFPEKTLTIRCKISRVGYKVSQSDLCIARSHLMEEINSFVWMIRNFSSLRPGQTNVLFVHPTCESLPILILSFFLQKKDGKEYGHIKIGRGPMFGSKNMCAGVSILNPEGFAIKSYERALNAWITGENETVNEISKFFERKSIMLNSTEFLPNDVLSLEFVFEINAGLLWSRIEDYRQLRTSDMARFPSETSEMNLDKIENTYYPFKKSLQSLFEDGTLTEISMKTGTFNFHKNILAARSPVFKALFAEETHEETAKYVNIPKISTTTQRRLLLYIYTKRVEKLRWKEASDLFEAAAKFELLDLREICSNFLKADITTWNACAILVLADTYHDKNLLTTVQNFILRNRGVFETNTWKDLKKKHIQLACETAELVIRQMKN